jgi:hypothetical protein
MKRHVREINFDVLCRLRVTLKSEGLSPKALHGRFPFNCQTCLSL